VRPLDSDDTRVLARCLSAMGASIEATTEGLKVHGPLAGPSGRQVLLDAGDSGTAARFLIALCAVTPGHFLLTGSARLRERPMGPLVTALTQVGAHIEFRGEKGFLPIEITGQNLVLDRVNVDASSSSQFISALLLAATALPGGLAVASTGPVASAPYVQMTIETLRAFGHAVETEPELRVRPVRERKERYEVPGDYSSAVPMLAASGVAGGEVCVEGLTWPSPDADAHAVAVLEGMGLEISTAGNRICARRSGEIRPVSVRAADFPDAVPSLVALSAFAAGASRFEGIAHLRLKESDRIGALAALLEAAGVSVRAEPDAISVEGPVSIRGDGPLRRLPTLGDHRIAMAAALLSLAVPGLAVENPGCVSKSYPAFFRDLGSLAVR
jgi:3-phosphoshikimate 1-carboxyvinyltransferase